MLNIKINWECDVLATYSVFRSESTMDPTELPVPIATELTTKQYIDIDIVADTIYFYRVRSTYNNKEYVSEETIASVTSQNLFVINQNENYVPPSAVSVNFTMSG